MIRIHINALAGLGKLGECIEYVAGLYREDPGCYLLLPIQSLVHSLDKTLRLQFRDQISLPILFQMYSAQYGPSLDTFLRSSYQQFLSAHGVRKPSELSRYTSRFNSQDLIYFLRYVCVSHVIDCSRALRTTRDVQNERIAVCQLLATLDPSNTTAFQEEIREVTTTQAVQAGILHMESSKVYVDVDGVRRAGVFSPASWFTAQRHLLGQMGQTVRKPANSNPETSPAESFGPLRLWRSSHFLSLGMHCWLTAACKMQGSLICHGWATQRLRLRARVIPRGPVERPPLGPVERPPNGPVELFLGHPKFVRGIENKVK